MCSYRTYVLADRLHPHPGVRAQARADRPSSGSGPQPWHRCPERNRFSAGQCHSGGGRRLVGHATGQALALSIDRAHQARSTRGEEQWADRPPARGTALRRRAGRAGLLYFDTRGGAAVAASRLRSDGRCPRSAPDHQRPPPTAGSPRSAAAIARPGQAVVVDDDRTKFRAAAADDAPSEPGRREARPSGVRRSDSLPGYRAAPSPNDWGRTAPGAWRGTKTMPALRTTPASLPGRPWSSSPSGWTFRGDRERADAWHGHSSTGSRPPRARRARDPRSRSARLVGGGSWRRTVTLRGEREAGNLRAALGPKLAELPAPVLTLGIELLVLVESQGRQLALVRPEGNAFVPWRG